LNKSFKIVFTLLIAIFMLPVFGSTVLAETESYDLENGEYDIDLESLHAEKDEPSGAAGFIGDEATLSIQNGNIELTVPIPHDDMAEITGLQVEGNAPTVEKGDETDYYTFQLDNLSAYLNAKVDYEVPSIGMVHKDVDFRFHLIGLEKLPVKENKPGESEKLEEEEKENNLESEDNSSENNDDDENNNLEENANESFNRDEDQSENEEKNSGNESNDENKNDSSKGDATKSGKLEGYYTINVSYFKTNSDEKSTMCSYLGNSAFLSVKDGKVNVTITVNEDETVTKLQIDGKNATEKKVDGDKRYETFVLDKLPSTINAYVEYQAAFQGSTFKGEADFDISFDKESLKDAKASDKPGYKVSEPKQKKKDPKKEEAKKGGNGETPKATDKNTSGKGKKAGQQDNLVPDKAYEIDYVVKHASKDEASAADSFFKKPAYLLYKNDEKYIQLTVTNSDMIDSLKTPNGDVIIVKENEDGSIVIQFKVDGDLSEAIFLDMHITVPGMYSMDHSARLFLDPNSKKEVDAAEFLLVASKNDNGPNGEGDGETLGGGKKFNEDKDNEKPNEDPSKILNKLTNTDNTDNTDNTNNTPEKPEFGSNGDNGKGSNTGNSGNAQNPQTGDTSGILLYALLLIGSLIPLAVKLKRRFV